MTLAIHEFQHSGRRTPHDLEAFIRDHQIPIVEGTSVTFVWRGQAEQVFLQHWVFGLASQQPFARLPGTDLWFLVMHFPSGSRVEYKLGIVRGGRPQLIQDPLNPHLARDPYGANSVVHAQGHVEPDWTREDSETRAGTLEELKLQSDVFRDVRPIQVYLPARFRSARRYPLLVVHDGDDYVRYARLKTVLDNLIHRLDIPPLIVALTSSANRLHEYANEPSHAEFLVKELVPLLEARFPLLPQPRARGLMGASFGAVATLATAWRHPGFFGNLLMQSGSFVFTDIGDHDRGPVFDPVVKFVNEFRAAPGHPAERAYVCCGIYESLIYYNRSMLPVFQSCGMNLRYTEVRDGHNWENWRDRLREGLSWLFPGPLWLVYE